MISAKAFGLYLITPRSKGRDKMFIGFTF